METMLRETRSGPKQMYLDPRTKMILCLTVSTVMLAGSNVGIMRFILPFLISIPLLFLIILKKTLVAAYYTVIYIFLSIIPNMLVPYMPPVVNLLFTGMLAICSKMVPAMSMFCFLVMSTSVSEFVAAMDRLHVPKNITIPVSVMFRFFPTIREEYSVIQDAMRLRRIGSLRNPMEMLEYRMVPLLISLVSIGNNLSASAMTRGLNAPKRRTNICPIGFYWQDIAVFVFCGTVFMIYLLSVLLGW